MLGKEIKELGLVSQVENAKVAHIALKGNDTIKAHNHPSELPYFVVVKGEVEVYLEHEGEKETHLMRPGTVLNFDGVAYISALAKEDSEIFVFLIKK